MMTSLPTLSIATCLCRDALKVVLSCGLLLSSVGALAQTTGAEQAEFASTTSSATSWSTAMSLGDDPQYLTRPEPFRQLDYTSPQATPGGVFRMAALGSFDKLNPFTLRGTQPRALMELVFEPLAIAALDEPSTVYGLLAQEMRLAGDGLSVTFRLNPRARFSNGDPVLAADVKHTFDTLMSPQASPIWRSYYADVAGAVVLDPRTVRFDFKRKNRELHLSVASLPIFSRAWGGGKPFDQLVLEPPIASGPYRIGRLELGRSIAYERRGDYWALQPDFKHPMRTGQFNFNTIAVEYFRDVFARLESFKAGDFDFIHENTAKNWARSYTGGGFERGELIKTELPNSNSAGLQAFYFNTRKPMFSDVRVREAIGLALDFEWMNRQLFYNQYRRSYSYFTNTELAADGEASEAEQALLDRVSSQVGKPYPAEWLGPPPMPPSTAAPASLRSNLRRARRLLEAAGWTIQNGRLRNAKGEPFEFELITDQRNWERVAAPLARNLEKLGITLRTRVMDSSLYQKRADAYDFDMIVHWYLSSQNPGNELLGQFGSKSAAIPGQNNYPGIRDPFVDRLIKDVLAADDRDQLVTAVHALDRVLRWGFYAIPHWYNSTHRVAYRNGLGLPGQPPLYYHSEDWAMTTGWWQDAARRGAGAQ